MMTDLNPESWDLLFPNRHPGFYTFKALLSAAARFPDFLSAGEEEIQIRELAAFLGHISFETGWIEGPGGFSKWGLYYIEENIGDDIKKHYSDSANAAYQPEPGQTYHGRGPIQLSWNYNYGLFSESWFGDRQVLLKNPGLVSADPVTAFASAIWFWMTPQFPKPSCHDIMTGVWKPSDEDLLAGRMPGFGSTINVVNGGLECGPVKDTQRIDYRLKYFEFFCGYFNISSGEHTGCRGQRPFGF